MTFIPFKCLNTFNTAKKYLDAYKKYIQFKNNVFFYCFLGKNYDFFLSFLVQALNFMLEMLNTECVTEDQVRQPQTSHPGL